MQSESLIILDQQNTGMTTEITSEPSKYLVNSNNNNNNYLATIKNFDTFNTKVFCESSDSDFVDSSRSNSIDSDKSTESNSVASQPIAQPDLESCCPHRPNKHPCSSPIKSSVIKSEIDQALCDVLDSGISSPTGNFSDHLNSTKREKSHLFKEKSIENYQSDPPTSDSSGLKAHNSKYQFRLPKIHLANHNSTNIGSIVNRIRSLSISMTYNPITNSRRASGDGSSFQSEPISPSPTTPEKDSDPAKLPKEHLHSSINFTSKNLRSSRKWIRMTHSLSCDAESYNAHDFSTKKAKGKYKISDEPLFISNHSPAQNRLEKYLSGHLDASTPSGALLKVINQGLRKVSESDRYLLFSKSPLRSPVDFLESGIEHLGDTEMLISVLHHSTCYDLMPESGKLVVFDSKIQIDKAFMALKDNYIDAAPVWCSNEHLFCGILTKEDQIYFLSLAYELNEHGSDIEPYIENLSKESVENCLGRQPEKHELLLVYPENTVASAIKQLQHSPCNKVLVLDEQRSGNALFVLDHGIILSFLLNASRAGLPLPSVLKTSVGVTELMLSRKSLDKYQVFLHTDMEYLLQIMNENPHHCALACVKKFTTNSCSCNYNCVAVITADHISHLISTSKVTDPTCTVQSILSSVTEMNQKVIRCAETDAVIDVIKLMSREKASLALISPDYTKQCVHSIISSKQLLDYIMKHDRDRSSPKESVFSVDKTRNFRSVSCCEDSQRITDINLSEVSLDEKDEDVFNMEMI